MGSKLAFILPLAVILISALFVFSTSKGTPISKQFTIGLITPTPYKNLSPNPSKATSSPTPTIDTKNTLSLDKIYTADQIQYFKTHQIYDYVKNVKFPPLPTTKSIDTTKPVYMFNCIDIAGSYQPTPIIDYIPKNARPIFETMHLMAAKPYASYPNSKEIADYQQRTQSKFKNQIGGVNEVNLDSNGTLFINYFDSVQSYGGGSTRLQCMGLSALLTAMQYPQVKSIKSCINQMPTSPDSCPNDFQP